MNWLTSIFPNVAANGHQILVSTWETIFMTDFTAVIGGLLGLTIGILLTITQPNGILAAPKTYRVLDTTVNLFRSVPFIVLLAVIGPFTKLIVGTTIGTIGVLVPLIIGVTPFYARQIQNALSDVDPGIIESATAMGASPLDIIFRVYLKEGLPTIIRVSVVTLISLIGLTAMAGVVGGGGLGDLAVSVGYQRFQNDITIVATVLILVLVFIVQLIGDAAAKAVSH